MKSLRLVVLAAAVAFALVAAKRRAVVPPVPLALNATRSFVITDKAILDGFGFDRFMTALVERSGTRTTALGLYQQWFDTQNARPGLAVADAPHCDDFLIDGKPTFNGFLRRCPTPEGALAKTDPFAGNEYIPIGITNRFDRAAVDGANCGEYRIVFARKGDPRDKLHIIFEGVLPNPEPERGLAACRPVAQFWADLTAVDSMSERRARIERFFFNGIDGFDPVVDPTHYAGTGSGRVRTLQGTPSSGDASLRFYQFRLGSECAGSNCRLMMLPDTLENQTNGMLFDGNNTSELARRFRDDFVKQVATLAIRDVNLYSMELPREYLMHESDPGGTQPAFIYDGPFSRSVTTADGAAFNERITAELTRIGSTLKPVVLINRAETQTCVGCHALRGDLGEGVVFPPSLSGAQQITEEAQQMIAGEAGPATRYGISPAIRDVFVPHRMEILRAFLQSGKPPVHSN